MNQAQNVTIEIPRAAIEQVAREVFESMNAAPPVVDVEAEQTKIATARILAKQFVTIAEAEFLLNCSRGHIGALIERASTGSTDHPIPYCDLDGLIVFEPSALLDWARTRKPLQRGKRRQGGKRSKTPPRRQNHLREIKQVVNS